MLTADGTRLAFVEKWPQRVGVADNEGVRQLVPEKISCQQYWITPDGRWVLVTGWPLTREHRRKPARVWLCDVEGGVKAQTWVPFKLPEGTEFAYVRNDASPPENQVVKSQPPTVKPCWCLIAQEPCLAVGPVEGEYYCWCPDMEPQAWERMSPAEFAGWVAQADCVLPATAPSPPDQNPFIVPLPCDGWNAARTVWVRPDGTVVELTRLRYVPNWIQIGLSIINAPLFVFPYYNAFFWGEIKSDLEGMRYDEQTHREAQAALQRAIQARLEDVPTPCQATTMSTAAQEAAQD